MVCNVLYNESFIRSINYSIAEEQPKIKLGFKNVKNFVYLRVDRRLNAEISLNKTFIISSYFQIENLIKC